MRLNCSYPLNAPWINYTAESQFCHFQTFATIQTTHSKFNTAVYSQILLASSQTKHAIVNHAHLCIHSPWSNRERCTWISQQYLGAVHATLLIIVIGITCIITNHHYRFDHLSLSLWFTTNTVIGSSYTYQMIVMIGPITLQFLQSIRACIVYQC